MRHSEGSRDELPEAVSGSPSARNVSHGCEADRRGPWKRSVRGLLGETGRLGLARPGSAAEGRGDGCLLAWFLRAWSGPQAVSNVRRARGRRGPHKRRATIAIRSVSDGASSAFVNRQAYGSLTRVVNEGRGRSVQIQAGRDASRRVRFSRPAPSHRPHGSHTFGLGEVGQTFGSFFQRRGEGKSQRAPLASPQTSGVSEGPLSPFQARLDSLSRIPAGQGGPAIPGSSLPTGEREGSQRELREREEPTCVRLHARESLLSRPRRSPAPATVRTVLIHSGWGKWDEPSGGFFPAGEGEESQRAALASL